MKADHGNHVVVSSHPGETRHWSQKWRRNTSRAAENAMMDLKKDLQINEEGRQYLKSCKKQPTRVAGKKPYGKY
jgi:hypothetical protein